MVHHNRHHHHQEYTRILGRWWLYVGWLHAWWTGGTAIMWLPLVFRTCFLLICLKQLLYFGWYVWNIYFTLVDMLEIFNILWLVCLKCLLNYYMFKTCHSIEMKCQIEFFFCDKNILWFRNISIFLIPHSLNTILFVFPSGRPPYEEWEQFKVQLRHIFPMTMKNLDINIFQELFQYSFWYFIIILWMGSTKWNGVDIELIGEFGWTPVF